MGLMSRPKPSWSIPLFPVFGIKLELHLTFLLLLAWAAVVGYQVQGVWTSLWAVAVVVGGFTCVVLHELGHSLTARLYGIHTHRILLLPIGGMAQLSEMPREPKRELLITVAGPAVNFILVLFLAALLYLGYARMDLATFIAELNQFSFTIDGFLRLMLFYNLAMGVFNCLPVFPMDGGRILRSSLAFRYPYLQATRIAIWVGRPLAVMALGAAVWYGHWLLVILFIFIFTLGELEWRFVRMSERYAHFPVGNLTAQRFFRTSPQTDLGRAVEQCLFDQPQEIVVCEGDHILGILTPEEIRRYSQQCPPQTLLSQISKPPSSVQANWPLSAIGKYLDEGSRTRLAVYDGEHLLGILRTDTLDGLLEWHRALHQVPHTPRFPAGEAIRIEKFP